MLFNTPLFGQKIKTPTTPNSNESLEEIIQDINATVQIQDSTFSQLFNTDNVPISKKDAVDVFSIDFDMGYGLDQSSNPSTGSLKAALFSAKEKISDFILISEFCEQIGAKPVYVLPLLFAKKGTIPVQKIDEQIDLEPFFHEFLKQLSQRILSTDHAARSFMIQQTNLEIVKNERKRAKKKITGSAGNYVVEESPAASLPNNSGIEEAEKELTESFKTWINPEDTQEYLCDYFSVPSSSGTPVTPTTQNSFEFSAMPTFTSKEKRTNNSFPCYVYVHHVTLHDIEARGFSRTVCLSYVTQEKEKIMNNFEMFFNAFSTVSKVLKFINTNHFIENMLTEMKKMQDWASKNPEKVEQFKLDHGNEDFAEEEQEQEPSDQSQSLDQSQSIESPEKEQFAENEPFQENEQFAENDRSESPRSRCGDDEEEKERGEESTGEEKEEESSANEKEEADIKKTKKPSAEDEQEKRVEMFLKEFGFTMEELGQFSTEIGKIRELFLGFFEEVNCLLPHDPKGIYSLNDTLKETFENSSFWNLIQPSQTLESFLADTFSGVGGVADKKQSLKLQEISRKKKKPSPTEMKKTVAKNQLGHKSQSFSALFSKVSPIPTSATQEQDIPMETNPETSQSVNATPTEDTISSINNNNYPANVTPAKNDAEVSSKMSSTSSKKKKKSKTDSKEQPFNDKNDFRTEDLERMKRIGFSDLFCELCDQGLACAQYFSEGIYKLFPFVLQTLHKSSNFEKLLRTLPETCGHFSNYCFVFRLLLKTLSFFNRPSYVLEMEKNDMGICDVPHDLTNCLFIGKTFVCDASDYFEPKIDIYQIAPERKGSISATHNSIGYSGGPHFPRNGFGTFVNLKDASNRAAKNARMLSTKSNRTDKVYSFSMLKHVKNMSKFSPNGWGLSVSPKFALRWSTSCSSPRGGNNHLNYPNPISKRNPNALNFQMGHFLSKNACVQNCGSFCQNINFLDNSTIQKKVIQDFEENWADVFDNTWKKNKTLWSKWLKQLSGICKQQRIFEQKMDNYMMFFQEFCNQKPTQIQIGQSGKKTIQPWKKATKKYLFSGKDPQSEYQDASNPNKNVFRDLISLFIHFFRDQPDKKEHIWKQELFLEFLKRFGNFIQTFLIEKRKSMSFFHFMQEKTNRSRFYLKALEWIPNSIPKKNATKMVENESATEEIESNDDQNTKSIFSNKSLIMDDYMDAMNNPSMEQAHIILGSLSSDSSSAFENITSRLQKLKIGEKLNNIITTKNNAAVIQTQDVKSDKFAYPEIRNVIAEFPTLDAAKLARRREREKAKLLGISTSSKSTTNNNANNGKKTAPKHKNASDSDNDSYYQLTGSAIFHNVSENVRNSKNNQIIEKEKAIMQIQSLEKTLLPGAHLYSILHSSSHPKIMKSFYQNDSQSNSSSASPNNNRLNPATIHSPNSTLSPTDPNNIEGICDCVEKTEEFSLVQYLFQNLTAKAQQHIAQHFFQKNILLSNKDGSNNLKKPANFKEKTLNSSFFLETDERFFHNLFEGTYAIPNPLLVPGISSNQDQNNSSSQPFMRNLQQTGVSAAIPKLNLKNQVFFNDLETFSWFCGKCRHAASSNRDHEKQNENSAAPKLVKCKKCLLPFAEILAYSLLIGRLVVIRGSPEKKKFVSFFH